MAGQICLDREGGDVIYIDALCVRRRLALFDFDGLLVVGSFSIERLRELGGQDIAKVAAEALRVVPVHPAKGGEFKIFDRLPWPEPDRPRTSSAL